MLLVCRRWDKGKGEKPPTRVVNLARNPATPDAALNVYQAIGDGTVESRGYGVVLEWPEHRVAAGDWGAVQFLSPYLCEGFARLKAGEVLPTVSLGDIAAVGPEGRRVRDAFNRSAMPGPEGMAALWEHKTDVTQGMAAKPDSHIIPKHPKAHLAESYWNQRSNLLLPSRLFLVTTRMLAVRLDNPGLGSAWVPCRIGSVVDSAEREKALCLYLNSSIGILATLGGRSNRKPTYPRFSIDDMRNYPVPNFAAIGGAAVSRLAAAYDRYATAVMLPLPQMNDCPVWQGLDAAVVDALGLYAEEVGSIRRQLAMEPSVTGKRYAGFGR